MPLPAIKLSRDIRPVTDLKTHGGEIVRQVVQDRQPVVFSRHGRAAAVLVSVTDYEEMEEARERLALLSALQEADREIDAGAGLPHAVMREKLLRWANGEQ